MMGQTTRPPTLGDRLDELMGSRHDTCDDVASAVGTSPEAVGRWAADRLVPEPDQYDAVARYLGADVDEVRRLVLRSQMRKVQREIRDGVGPASTRP
jgi:transcriptional regulator with XRE-family HTH domain